MGAQHMHPGNDNVAHKHTNGTRSAKAGFPKPQVTYLASTVKMNSLSHYRA